MPGRSGDDLVKCAEMGSELLFDLGLLGKEVGTNKTQRDLCFPVEIGH